MIELVHPVSLSPLGVLAIVAAIGCFGAFVASSVFASARWRMVFDAALGAIGALVASGILPMSGFGPATASGSLVMAFIGAGVFIGLPRAFGKMLR